jgi:hypothetical protein
MNFKNFNFWDICLTKLAVLFAALFLVSVWHGLADWVTNTHWAWFLIISLILAIKPWITACKKK